MEIEGYKLIKNKHGNRFMKDNKFVKFSSVPLDIKGRLEGNMAADSLDPKKCIFCGEPATETRFINLQTVALCSADFYDKKVGQIVNRLKELYHGEKAKTTD